MALAGVRGMARAQLANCRVILGRFSNCRLCFALPRLQSQADATAVLGDELQASALEGLDRGAVVHGREAG
jgi:hypothetical protein